jgi:anti-sigma factor RsiW
MTHDDRISAWLDGALSQEEAKALEAEAMNDAALATRMAELSEQDRSLKEAFDLMLDLPVPEALETAAQTPATPEPANLPRAPRMGGLIAAGLALLIIGMGSGAYLTNTMRAPQIVTVAPGWMEEIASYHRVYARQVRHLVEVPAEEKDHIEKWLTKETGAQVTVPDLAASGYDFRGARLLVAAGKPVAQLIYTDTTGAVVALCALQSDKTAPGFTTKEFDGVQLVRWTVPGAAWVAVGEAGMPLDTIAQAASATL